MVQRWIQIDRNQHSKFQQFHWYCSFGIQIHIFFL